MIVNSAEFITSAAKPSQFPSHDFPEIAFAGRSNAGKSSMINSLLQRKQLVKTSRTPGKTRLINFFLVNHAFVFVDLPGYGYAKVSKAMRFGWQEAVEAYLVSRKGLKGVVLIMDIRRSVEQEELDLIQWMTHFHIHCRVAASKTDKISKSEQFRRRNRIASDLSMESEAVIPFSAKTRQGTEALWNWIDSRIHGSI
ncbi:MAG: ribosome biogenesis GTP-binding protein YihA/YsxC [Thermodesulfobacteriota bacterium]